MQPEYRNLNRMFPKNKSGRGELENVSLESIAAILPPRDICDEFVSSYVSYFEHVHRILHVPTFLGQCNYFWDGPSATNQPFRSNFIPQLAVVITIGSQLQEPGISTPYPPSAALTMDSLIDAYMRSLSSKQRMQLASLQTACLLIVSKRLLLVPPDELWIYTGDLLRTALNSGLHKDPEEIDRGFLPLQVELRRRLWYTAMELDIEASMLCCMPSLVQVTSYSCRCPSANDDELSSALEDEWNGVEAHAAKSIALQTKLAQSLPVRLRALRVLTRSHPDPKEIHIVLAQLADHDKSLASNMDSDQQLDPIRVYSSYLLRVCIQRPIVSLYLLCLQCPGFMNVPDVNDSFVNCLFSCLEIMSLSENLDPDVSSFDFFRNDTCWRLFNVLEVDDVLRAMYCACLCSAVLKNQTSTNGDPTIIELAVPGTIRTAVRRGLEGSLKSFAKRFPDLRPVLKQLMGLAIINQLTKHTTSEARKQELMQTALQNFIQLCRERFAADASRIVSTDTTNSDVFSIGPAPEFDLCTADNFGFDSTLFDWNPNFFFDTNLHGTPSGIQLEFP